VKASRYDAGLVVITALTGILWDLDKAVSARHRAVGRAVRAAGRQTQGGRAGDHARGRRSRRRIDGSSW